MYAPRQYRPEKKRPDSKFLTTENPEHEGPVMAPPAFSTTGEKNDNDKDDELAQKLAHKEKVAGEKPEAETGAAVAQTRKDQDETSQMKSDADGNPLQQKQDNIRTENPPQFKLAAGAPAQFMFAHAPLQMKAAAPSSGAGGGSGASGGLPEDVKAKMEGSFGQSFDNVKVTANSNEAKKVGALAFAQGNNIHFAPGQYNPATPGGQELIGHELAHVVQQSQGRVKANTEVGGKAANTEAHHEAEADRLGAKAANYTGGGSGASKNTATGSGPVQAKLDPKAFSITGKDDSVEENATGQKKNKGKQDKEEDPLDKHLALGGTQPEAEDKAAEDLKGEKKEQEAEQEHQREEEAQEKENKKNNSEEKDEQEETEKEGSETENDVEDKQEGDEDEGEEKEEDKDEKQDEEEKDQKEEQEGAAENNAGGEEGAGGEGGSEGAGEGGAGAEGAGNGAGGGTEGGSGGGAGGGAGSGGGAGAGGGADSGIEVKSPVLGNFGEGSEPDMMVVNDAALPEFGSDMVLKDNGDGTSIVMAGNIPASDSSSSDDPVQMIKDPNGKDTKKPVKKKLSKQQAKAMGGPNRDKVKAALNEFQSGANAQIGTLESAKSGVAGQVNSGASAAKSSIMAAAAAEKSRIESSFAAIKAALMSDAERVKGETVAAMETAKAGIQASAATARTNVETAYQTQDAAFVALEPATKTAITATFDKGKADMIESAKKLGLEAIETGKKEAAVFEAMPIPEQSRWQKIKNGGDFEKDRHKARVEAAKSVAKSYQDQFLQKANEEGAKLKANGEAEMHKYVADSTVASRDAIKARKDAALAEITAAETGAIATVQSNCDAMLLGIDSTAQEGIVALEGQQAQAVGQIETTADGKVQAADAVASEKIANLEDQIQSAIDALKSQVNSTVTGVSARKNPNSKGVKKQLDAVMASISDGVAQGMTLATGGAAAAREGMMDMAKETASELSTAANSHIDGGGQTKDAIVMSLEGQRDQFKTTAASVLEGATAMMTQNAETAASEMKAQYDAVKADFDSATKKLEGKIGENSTAFEANIQTQLNGLSQKIKDEAKKAYDAVKPRWVAWLLTAIDILVVIIITAVVLVAVASGVGILGLLLIGAVAGAVGGAIKYGARVGLTSEEASWSGLGLAMVEGAVDGVNIAVGMIPGLGPVAAAASQIGAGAIGGAVKYGAEVMLTDKEFSWSGLAGKTFLGGVEGAMGLIGGKAGDGVSNYLTKKIGAEAMERIGSRIIVDVAKTGTEAAFDTVNGGITAMVDNYLTTGTLDFGKFTEQLTLENLLTNAATSKVTDIGSSKLADATTSRLGITPAGGDDNGSSVDRTTTTDSDSTTTPDVDTTPTTDTHTPDTNNNDSPDLNPVTDNTPVKSGDGDTPTPTPDADGPIKSGDSAEGGDGATQSKGESQAEVLGYPPSPDGYQWVAKADGTPYLRRESGRSADLPPVKYDAASGRFKPDVPAPDGYHWKHQNGEFIVSRNPNMADSLPALDYDPATGGYKTKDGGEAYSGDISALTVRGQDIDGFTDSVDGLSADPETAKQAFELYAKKDWAALEALFTEKGLNGGWPPNRGFIDRTPGEMAVGDKFDRFGGWVDKDGVFQDKGTFVADYGADFAGRALPQTTIDGDAAAGKDPAPFRGYEVLKPIPTVEGDAIPWFGQPGGNKQYELPMSINDLKAQGYIKEIGADVDAIRGDSDSNVTPDVDGDIVDGPELERGTDNDKVNDDSAPTPDAEKVPDSETTPDTEINQDAEQVEHLSEPELERFLSESELPGKRDIKNDKLLRAKSTQEFVGLIARWLNTNFPSAKSTQFIMLHDVAAVRAYENKVMAIMIKNGVPESLAFQRSRLIDNGGSMANAAAFNGKIALLPDTIRRIESRNIDDRAKAMKTICHEWWHAMRKGRRHGAFEEGGADLFSELMTDRITESSLEHTNSYQNLKDGVELLRNAMGEKWFLDSRNVPDTKAYLESTLLAAGYDPDAVKRVVDNSAIGSDVTQRDWLENVRQLLN